MPIFVCVESFVINLITARYVDFIILACVCECICRFHNMNCNSKNMFFFGCCYHFLVVFPLSHSEYGNSTQSICGLPFVSFVEILFKHIDFLFNSFSISLSLFLFCQMSKSKPIFNGFNKLNNNKPIWMQFKMLHILFIFTIIMCHNLKWFVNKNPN